MKLTPYKKLLVMGKEALDATLAPVRARAAQKQAELEVCKLEETIATLENQVHEACSKKDLNFSNIIDKMDELALAERRKTQLEKITKELFPE